MQDIKISYSHIDCDFPTRLLPKPVQIRLAELWNMPIGSQEGYIFKSEEEILQTQNFLFYSKYLHILVSNIDIMSAKGRYISLQEIRPLFWFKFYEYLIQTSIPYLDSLPKLHLPKTFYWAICYEQTIIFCFLSLIIVNNDVIQVKIRPIISHFVEFLHL
jgi:hypothetical protein